MDPFLGLGSSAVAAAGLGVDFIGVEIDEHYLVEAIARVRRALKSPKSQVPSPSEVPSPKSQVTGPESQVPSPEFQVPVTGLAKM